MESGLITLSGPAADLLHEHLNGACVRFLARTVPFAGTIPEDPAFARAVKREDITGGAAELGVEGRGFADTASPYDRLPPRARALASCCCYCSLASGPSPSAIRSLACRAR